MPFSLNSSSIQSRANAAVDRRFRPASAQIPSDSALLLPVEWQIASIFPAWACVGASGAGPLAARRDRKSVSTVQCSKRPRTAGGARLSGHRPGKSLRAR